MTVLWWIIWWINGEPAITASHWLSFLILAIGVDMVYGWQAS